MDTKIIRRFVELKDELSGQEAATKELKAEVARVEEQVLEQFAAEGVDSVRVDGRTVWMRRELWAALEPGVARTAVNDALRGIGLEHFVTESFNTSTLSAWMREREAEGEDLPDELKGLITGREVYRVSTRRS